MSTSDFNTPTTRRQSGSLRERNLIYSYHAADFHATNGSLFMKTHNMDEVPVSFIGGHFSTGDHE